MFLCSILLVLVVYMPYYIFYKKPNEWWDRKVINGNETKRIHLPNFNVGSGEVFLNRLQKK